MHSRQTDRKNKIDVFYRARRPEPGNRPRGRYTSPDPARDRVNVHLGARVLPLVWLLCIAGVRPSLLLALTASSGIRCARQPNTIITPVDLSATAEAATIVTQPTLSARRRRCKGEDVGDQSQISPRRDARDAFLRGQEWRMPSRPAASRHKPASLKLAPWAPRPKRGQVLLQ